MLAACRSWDEGQRHASRLWGDYASSTRLAYRSTAADVEGYQVSHRVESFVLELVLGPLVHRFWLDHHLLIASS